MPDEIIVAPDARAGAAADARKSWERPALRVLGAKFASNTHSVCADKDVPNRDNGNLCSTS